MHQGLLHIRKEDNQNRIRKVIINCGRVLGLFMVLIYVCFKLTFRNFCTSRWALDFQLLHQVLCN